MLFKKRFNRGIALEVITEGILFECDSEAGAHYVRGLCGMARELGLITPREMCEFIDEARQKAQAANFDS